MLFGDHALVHRVGTAGQGQPATADPLIRRQGHPIALALLPEPQQAVLQQRQGRRLAQEVAQQRVDQPGFEVEAHLLGRTLDRLAQLAGGQRRQGQITSLVERLQRLGPRKKRLEVAAHGQHDSPVALIACPGHHPSNKLAPLRLVATECEGFLELVDDQEGLGPGD